MALWEQWREEQQLKQSKPKVEKPKKETIVYRLITEREMKAIKALNGCRFLPGSYDKRFVRDMRGGELISEKQAAFLRLVFYRYRRQLGLTNEAAKAYFD